MKGRRKGERGVREMGRALPWQCETLRFLFSAHQKHHKPVNEMKPR